MNWKIKIDKIALKFIAKQPQPQRKRIMQAISRLPYEGDIKPMAGRTGFYRLRVGTYRVIYIVREEEITVYVTDAGNRGDILYKSINKF